MRLFQANCHIAQIFRARDVQYALAEIRETNMTDNAINASNDTSFSYRRIKSETEKPDTRARYFLFFIQDGQATLISGSERYPLRRGDVVIALEGHAYTLESEAGGCVADELSLRSFVPSDKIKQALKRLPTVLRSSALSERVAELVSGIANEAKSPDEYSEEAAIGLIHTLLVAIVRGGGAGAEASEISAPVATAIAHINAHLGERLMLGEVAAICEVSAAYLSRRFKSEIGTGFADYVARSRLEKAGTMLREHPELSITEIAFSCGFNDSNYFSDKFKHHFGIPPLKFRKR